MTYKFLGDKPIFLQLAEIIKNEIVSGRIKAGEKLNSVREYSALYKVNPNTVQKALYELEEQGLIYTDRTNGKFVSDDLNVVQNVRRNEVKAKVQDFLFSMKNFGLTKKEIIKIINNLEGSDEWIVGA